MTPLKQGEGGDSFRCDDGLCVKWDLTCDDKEDCRDGSDENGCKDWKDWGLIIEIVVGVVVIILCCCCCCCCAAARRTSI